IDDGTPAPGRRLKGAFRCIGGQQADPASHIGAVLDCLEEIWSGAPDVPQVQAATSALLRQLIRERHRDYRAIIVALLQRARRNAVVHNFILGWARGHFLLA
ncbi:MAG TPA: hypothetical protein VM915_06500, partial [Verrucomicrobiae bacterium]|nr:hypothetical protein [Verrucomicrobiae bacterium]